MHVFECINLAKIDMEKWMKLKKTKQNMLDGTMECIQFSNENNTTKQNKLRNGKQLYIIYD